MQVNTLTRYMKIRLRLHKGEQYRKYNRAAGATKGHTGESAIVHKKTTPESTYIRYGIGPPGPPPITHLAVTRKKFPEQRY